MSETPSSPSRSIVVSIPELSSLPRDGWTEIDVDMPLQLVVSRQFSTALFHTVLMSLPSGEYDSDPFADPMVFWRFFVSKPYAATVTTMRDGSNRVVSYTGHFVELEIAHREPDRLVLSLGIELNRN